MAVFEERAFFGSPVRPFTLLLLLWLGAFVPIYPELLRTWLHHPDNSHGVLVPLISLFLLWQKRERLRQAEVSSSAWGVVLLAIGLILYVAAYAGAVTVAARAMLVVTLVGLVLFNLGRQVFRVAAFPLLFLFFMVPLPDSLVNLVAFPLQLFATDVSAQTIRLLSIPVYQEGNMLHFARTSLEVAEACSGIRSVVSLVMLSAVFSYTLQRGTVRRVFLLLSAVPVAILTNIVRVSGTGVLAHFFGDSAAKGFLHEFSGLTVFGFGFLAIYLEYQWLDRQAGRISKKDPSKGKG